MARGRMKWTRASKYHEESGSYYLAAVKVGSEWKFTLTRGSELVGVFATSALAKKEAERHGRKAGN